MSITVRINDESRSILRVIAEETGETMPSILEKALEAYRRKRFLQETNEAYAALRKNAGEWAKLERERKVWDGTLDDGLDADEKAPSALVGNSRKYGKSKTR